MRYIVLLAVAVCVLGSTFVAAADFAKTEVANNSKELDYLLQGGNKNLYLVNFYMPGDNHEDVKKDLQQKIAGNARYKDLVTYIEVNAARTYQYKDVLQDVGIYNRPAKMYPYVLLIQAGEGYIFRGGDIGDLVSKKITQVIEGRVDYSTVN